MLKDLAWASELESVPRQLAGQISPEPRGMQPFGFRLQHPKETDSLFGFGAAEEQSSKKA